MSENQSNGKSESQCVAEGRPEDVRPLTWFQKTFGLVFPIRYAG